MAKSTNIRWQILCQPIVPYPERRKLHAPDCRWAFSPKMQRERSYRDATAEEIRTHARCGHC